VYFPAPNPPLQIKENNTQIGKFIQCRCL